MKIIVENGLRELLAERRVPSASKLARMMAPYLGKQLSTAQINRYMHDAPPAFDLKFIGAACSALHCLPSDFFRIRIECGPDDNPDDLGPLPKRADVVWTEPRRPSTRNAGPPEKTGPERSNEDRRAAEESIRSGPRADVFPFPPANSML